MGPERGEVKKVAYSEMIVKRVKQQIDMLEQSLRHLLPDGGDYYLYINKSGGITFTAMQWGEKNEDGKFTNTPRRMQLELSKVNGNWLPDKSAESNDSYEKKGILMKEEVEKDA